MTTLALGILEADPVQGDRLPGFFAAQGIAVERYRDPATLLAALPARAPEMLLLGAAGCESPSATLALLREIRALSRVPAVVLGATDDIDQVAMLEAGADDVVPRSL